MTFRKTLVSKLLLAAVAVWLLSADASACGRLKLLGGGGRAGGRCCPQAAPQFPAQMVAAPAALTPVVVQTSYSGVGVPVDPTPYQPIRLGRPLPVPVFGPCGPGGCR